MSLSLVRIRCAAARVVQIIHPGDTRGVSGARLLPLSWTLQKRFPNRMKADADMILFEPKDDCG